MGFNIDNKNIKLPPDFWRTNGHWRLE